MPFAFSKFLFCCLRVGLFLVRPVVNVRLGLISHRSIGRISGNVEYYLRRQKLGLSNQRTLDILGSGSNPVNRQILAMIKRKVRVIENDFVWKWLRNMQGESPIQTGRQGAPPDIPMWIDLRHAGFMVEWDTWQQVNPQMHFTDNEHTRGIEVLRALGVPAGATYVTMHARDKVYTDSPDYIRSLDDPLSYNDFRDCDINTYIKAAQWLTDQGIWVIRVGQQVEGPLSTSDPMIVDYAGRFRRHLEDAEFADVYLQATSKFFIGCTAGTYYLSHIFNVPIASVNMIPLAECGRLDHDLFILKKYWQSSRNRFLTFREMAKRGADWNRLWHDKLQAFKDEGIEYIDNSPEEILDLVMEMYNRLEGNWLPEPDDSELQNQFRKIFPADNPMREFPGYLGAEYTRQNRDIIG